MLPRWRATLFALHLYGCMSVYVPPGPVVPLQDERGDVSVGGNLRPVFPSRGANAYVAYAPTPALRLFLNGSLTRYEGRHLYDYAERQLRERNHTTQLEAAAGWAWVQRQRVAELFAGFGFGRSEANQCWYRYDIIYGPECKLWVDSRSWFVRPFVQAHVGRRYRVGTTGGGARLSTISYLYERLLGEPSDRVGTAVAFEPFFSQSLGYPWGKLELQFLVPIVVGSQKVRYTRRFSDGASDPSASWQARLIQATWPRLTIGVRADLDELWRNR